MIRFILLQNRQGRTRLAKYYVPLEDAEKRKLEVDIHRLVVNRDPKVTNFLEVRPRPRRGACSAASGSADELKALHSSARTRSSTAATRASSSPCASTWEVRAASAARRGSRTCASQ